MYWIAFSFLFQDQLSRLSTTLKSTDWAGGKRRMVSSRSPGVSVTCNNNNNNNSSSTVDVPNKSDLAVNNSTKSSTGEESEFNQRNDNEGILNNERTRWNSESGPPSFSMSIDLNHHDSGSFSASPDPNNAPSCEVKVTRNHEEEEERYEAFGSVEGDCDEEESPGGSSSAPSPTGPASLRWVSQPTKKATENRKFKLKTLILRKTVSFFCTRKKCLLQKQEAIFN